MVGVLLGSVEISLVACLMKTLCPYLDCGSEIEVTVDNKGRSNCPQCGRLMTPRPPEVLAFLARKQSSPAGSTSCGFACLLEDVRSLYNVGSMFRTADGAGLDALVLTGITGCPPHKRIAKTSLGAEDSVPWSYHQSALSGIQQARASGSLILALEYLAADDPHFPPSLSLTEFMAGDVFAAATAGPLLLLVGNEVTGISAEALAASDAVCHLPMHGIKESLNVACAFAIATYRIGEARRARLN